MRFQPLPQCACCACARTGRPHAHTLVSPRARSLSSEAGSPGLQLIIVRHGQSTNNLIQDHVEKRMREEGLLAADAERIWLTERVHDPGLSEKGHAEAAAAGAELLRYLGPERGRAALVVLSPMLRALLYI